MADLLGYARARFCLEASTVHMRERSEEELFALSVFPPLT